MTFGAARAGLFVHVGARAVVFGCLLGGVWSTWTGRAADATLPTLPILPTLTNLQQIVALGRSGALDAANPVRVRGVVTFPSVRFRESLYIHDETNGVTVALQYLPGFTVALYSQVKIGQLVEVEGELAAGPSHPYIGRATVRILGPGRLPEVHATRGRELAQGRFHGDLVKLRASVLDVSREGGTAVYLLYADGYSFNAFGAEQVDHLPVEHLNAMLELQGVAWSILDTAGKPNGFRLLVGSNEWVRVVTPGSSNLLAGARRTLQEVASRPLSDERVVVSGVVTYATMQNFFTLEDSTGVACAYGLVPLPRSSRDAEHVARPPRPELRPGDRIEVVASRNTARPHAPVLNGAEYRVLGRGTLPEPPLITEESALTGEYDCRRVRMQGRVVDRDSFTQGETRMSRLWVKFGEHTTFASHAGIRSVEFPVAVGSRVEVTGLCVVSAGTTRPVRSFALYVTSPTDARLLSEPPVWLDRAVLRTAGIAGGVLLLALSWVWLLRRQVARQTAELRRSEERFYQAFKNSPGSLAILSYPEGRYLDVNDGFGELFGWPREQVLGRTSLELGLWPDPATRERLFQLFRDTGGYHNEETPVRRRSGERMTVVQSGELIEIGGRKCILVTALDITARKAAELALAASEARTRLIVDTALDAVISMDTSGRITGWNAQAEAAFGWPAAEVLGRFLSDTIIPPAQREAHRRGLEHFLATGVGPVLNRRIETTALHRNGHEFPVELSISPVHVGEALSFSAFVRDITARKQAETELRKALESERELGELKSSFVSMVSHEFRTPLEVIISSADILERYLDRLKPEQRARHLQSIQGSVKRMAAMMEEVLLLGRFDAGRLQFKPDDLHLAAWCRRLVEEMHSAYGPGCPIELIVADFPPLVRADEGLLRHILTNLLSNAVKYSPAGAPVLFKVTRDGDDVVFRVEDRGIGIPASDQARVFEAFHRGGNTDQVPGTGLGLVIVKRCVELHAGQIEFSSAEGQGAVFTVRLPLFEHTQPVSPPS